MLLAVLAAVLSLQLAAPPLERAEIYFLDASRTMAEGGDWIVPRYEGEPFFDKPILSYWLMAACMRALGPSAAAARLVPLAASLLVILTTAWLGTLLFDRRSALAGALALVTTVAFLSFGRVAMSDMLLAFWTTLAVGLGVRAYRPASMDWPIVALGAVLGLGFATKGPIALLIPGIALVLVAWGHRDRPAPWRAGSLAAGAAVFVVLGLGWFALVYRRLGAEPLVYFFLRENLERFAGETYDSQRPLWFYLPAYLAEGLPWSSFLPIALWRLLRGSDWEHSGRGGARVLAIWVALVLVPLSLSRGKIDYYLLPLYPPVSLLLGRYFVSVPWRRGDRVYARVVLLLAGAAAFALLTRPPRIPQPWLPGAAPRTMLLATLSLAAVALLVASLRPMASRAMAVLAATVAAVFVQVVLGFMPAFSRGQPNRAIAADVARERRYQPRAQLAFCSDPSRARRDVLFLARHTAVQSCDLWSYAASREPFLLLVTAAQNASFQGTPGYRHVASYRYLPADTLSLVGLYSRAKPGEMVLFANYKTSDPEAERKRKREYRKWMQNAYGTAPP